MPQVQLSLEAIKKLDCGKLDSAFQNDLQHAVKDILDRPTDGRGRKVAIVFTLKPWDDKDPDCDGVAVEAEIVTRIPPRRSKVYQMDTKVNGTLIFNEDSPEDPNRKGLYDDQATD